MTAPDSAPSLSGPNSAAPDEAAPSAPSPAPRSRRWEWLAVAVFFVYLGVFFGRAQIGSPGLVERDGYFHARFAQMLPELGLTRHFPWTEYSTWKDRFCDKEFLFHAVLVPFAFDQDEPLNGVRWGIWTLTLAIFAVLYGVLRGLKVRWPLLFLALLLCTSHPFLGRIVMIRSHVLSISLLLLGMYFLARKNWKAVLILGFVYAWSYTVPFVLLMTAAPFVAGRWSAGGGLDWKSAVAAGAGATLGLAIHPYAPHTFESILTYIDVIRSGAQGVNEALELGQEIYPYHTRDFFLALPLLAGSVLFLCPAGWWARKKWFVAALVVSALWLLMMLTAPASMHTKAFLKERWHINLALLAFCASGWRFGKKITPEALGALWAALFWFAMTMAFSRFMEYAVPLAALALALLARDLLAGLDFKRDLLDRFPVPAWSLSILGALGLAALFANSAYTFSCAAYDLPGNNFRKASQWLDAHVEPGETVVNLWWDDFPELYYYSRKMHYLVGLDPTYMQRYAPEKLHVLETMRRRGMPMNGPLLAKTFNARYMIMRGSAAITYPEMTGHAWKGVYIDDYAAVFALTGPNTYAPPGAAAATDDHPETPAN
ncbi:MAG: hypothetical protein HY291_14680 [Planctomycetes bacterium]|nr:hypothetical protein [Planctomycetota bacterium]